AHVTVILASAAPAAHVPDHAAECFDVLEALVDGCEADVGDLVELEELGHDEFADTGRGDLACATGEQGFLDVLGGFFGIQCADRTLAQGKFQACPDLGRVVFATVAVALDHHGHLQLGTLVGGETPVAGGTAPAPA